MIWIVFGCMLLAAALVVAVPMFRHERQFNMRTASAVLIVSAIAVGVYGQVGSPGATLSVPQESLPDVDAMVASLQSRLQASPEDVDGWKMLGRSYVQLQRYADAASAFEQALERETGNAGQTLADLGEATLLAEEAGVRGRAAELFERALAAAPDNPKALFYGGIGASERGDTERAAARWEALLASSPPPEVRDILRRGIAEWRGTAAADAAPPSTVGDTPLATIEVSLSPAAGSAVPADATVFVIARDPGQPSPPIAAVRRRVSELPDRVALSDADAMIPGRSLSAFTNLEIVARVSMSGGPIAQPGDWFGSVLLDTGESRQGRVVIDRVVE